MLDYEFSVLTNIYLTGKKIQSLVKRHNSDLMSQSIILRLAGRGQVSVSDIAELFSIKVSAATSKIQEMESKGLLVRLASSDRRAHVVRITPEGTEILQKHTENMHVHCHDHHIGITEHEAHTLERIMKKIIPEEFI